MYSVRQKKTKYANQNAKYAKQNTKCANSIKRVRQTNKYWFTLFCRDAIFVANLRTFLAYNWQAKNCGGVQKMTNMRYASGRADKNERYILAP